jgi:hypothetical protein
VTRVIKEKHSTRLSDQLREGKDSKKQAFVASSTGTRFFGTEPRKTNHRVQLCWSPLDLFPLCSLSKVPLLILIWVCSHGYPPLLSNSLQEKLSIALQIISNTNPRYSACSKFIFLGFSYLPPPLDDFHSPPREISPCRSFSHLIAYFYHSISFLRMLWKFHSCGGWLVILLSYFLRCKFMKRRGNFRTRLEVG